MKVRTYLSIGFPGAMQEDEIEIDEEELEGLTEAEKDNFIFEELRAWAEDKIEYWYEVDDEQ